MDKKEYIFDKIIKDYNDVLYLDKWEPEEKIKTELLNMIKHFKEININEKEFRYKQLIYLINRKLDLNKKNIKKFIDYIASHKVYFNYHEKEIITRAFDSSNKQMLIELLDKKIRDKEIIQKALKLFITIKPVDSIEAINNFEGDKLDKLLNAIFSGYVYYYFDENDVRSYFTCKDIEYIKNKDYYEFLSNRYTDIFDRNCSLLYLDLANTYMEYRNYNLLRNNVLNMMNKYYKKLNNHCYLAINIGQIIINNKEYQWDLFADILLYGEKFREIELKAGYFKPDKIETITKEYIKNLNTEEAKFNISNEGYIYKDCFVLNKGETYDILILMQKHEKDERIIPCPACWSDNIQGNSYPIINVRSWECKNPLCCEKSKTNRGKRYSMESLIKQKAIDENENLIPIESIRKWRLDILKSVEKIDIISMLLRHYSLVGDTVVFITDYFNEREYLSRNIINETFDLENVDNIFEEFEQSCFFKRFMYKKEYNENKVFNDISNINGVKIFNGDCFKVIDCFKNNSIDGVVTSPPYYNAKDYSTWPNIYCYLYDMYNIIDQVYRVMKDDSVFLFNIFDYFDNENSIVFSDMGKKRIILGAYMIYIFRKIGFKVQGNIIWDKGEIQGNRSFNQGNLSPYYQAPLNTWEHIFIFSKGNYEVQYPKVLKAQPVIKYVKGKNVLGHDAPFPKNIPKLLIENMNSDQIILDPFSGSMTTGRTAYERNIKSINIEFMEEYCHLGLKLLNEEINNIE